MVESIMMTSETDGDGVTFGVISDDVIVIL